MDGKKTSLPKPKFETRVIEKDRSYYQICFVSCLKKHKRRSKLEKNCYLASFKFYSEKWKSVDHKYSKAFGFVDWNNTDEKKACKSTFFKESFLHSQRLTENYPNENDTLSAQKKKLNLRYVLLTWKINQWKNLMIIWNLWILANPQQVIHPIL